jgi:hypothetical protein
MCRVGTRFESIRAPGKFFREPARLRQSANIFDWLNLRLLHFAFVLIDF